MIETVEKTLKNKILKKMVFSASRDPDVIRVNAAPFTSSSGEMVQFETLRADGKALHRNVTVEEAPAYANELFKRAFNRANVITTSGEFQIMRSKKGKVTRIDRIRYEGAQKAQVKSHDSDRNYIIREGTPCLFLEKLGVCDAEGARFRPQTREIPPDKPLP